MSRSNHPNQPQAYVITVRGQVTLEWAEYLGGLEIKSKQGADQTTTTLSGKLIDQADLLGVLNNLYTLGYSIISVTHQVE